MSDFKPNDQNDNPKKDEKPKKEKHPNMGKKRPDIPWDKLLGWQGFHQSVFVFSYYFKKAGMPQKLSFGDWYYTVPDYKPALYVKSGADTYEDIKFLTSGKYVRILSPDECWGVILSCNYVPSFNGAFSFNQETMKVEFRVESTETGDSIGVVGSTIHDVLIAVAFKVYSLCKNISDFSQEIMETPTQPFGEDDDE